MDENDFVTSTVVGILEFATRFVSDVWRTRLKKKILRTMLRSPRYKWGRRIGTLSGGIRESQETTEQYLLEIGAHRDEKGKDIWTLHLPN